MQLSATSLALFPSSGPIAVAVSGGGDSMALLGFCLSRAGGKVGAQSVHALIVDHGLRDGSNDEAKLTAKRCSDMGATPHILTWSPPPLKTAIQEQARKARYGLMGDKCRELGATDLLVGHTQDDQAETVYIRGELGANWRGLAGIGARVYAPVWPQLYGVYLTRPLLGYSRAALRSFNTDNGIEWLEDPSNENPDFHRVRARAALVKAPDLRAQMLVTGQANRERREIEEAGARTLLSQITGPQEGGFHIPDSLANDPSFKALLPHILACASGSAHRPDFKAVSRLADKMKSAQFSAATLGGAVVARHQDGFEIARETGRWLAAKPLVALVANAATLFDGRVSITTWNDGYEARALWPERKSLMGEAKVKFAALSQYARRSAFGVFGGDELLAAPQIDYAARPDICTYEDIAMARLLAF